VKITGKIVENQQNYSDTELRKIGEEAMIFMCACPGQVASTLLQLRQLIRYQRECINGQGGVPQVHETIEKATMEAEKIMENCLAQVLELEIWDRQTLKMPEGLRQLRDDILSKY
jgi:hypothetical protein